MTRTRGGNLGRWTGVCLAMALLFVGARAPGQINERPAFLDGVGLEERLGARVPLELTFTDSQGRSVALSESFASGRPVVLALVYYRCPVVCTMVMERMVESFNGLDYSIGEGLNVVCLSFDDREGPTIAQAKKNEVIVGYERGASRQVTDNWAFLTGDATSVRQVADAVGFHYNRLPNGEYAHPIAIAVLSPDGKVCRYFYGYDYPPGQMKLALLDASDGRVARSIADRVLHFCYQFDPTAGAYTLQAMQVMKLGGLATMVLLGGLVGGLLLVERRRRRGACGSGEQGKGSEWDGNSGHKPGPAGHTS